MKAYLGALYHACPNLGLSDVTSSQSTTPKLYTSHFIVIFSTLPLHSPASTG